MSEEEQKLPSSRPFMVQQYSLQSFHAQQVFKRGFDIYSRSVYSISVVLRAVTNEENVREVEGFLDEKLNNASEDLRREIAQLGKTAEDNGITLGNVDYSNPGTVEAKISSHRSARYINLIREYDSLVANLDALWLSGIIPDRDYSQKIYEWKRRILRIASHAGGVVRQLAAESRKKNVIELPSTADPKIPESANKVSAEEVQDTEKSRTDSKLASTSKFPFFKIKS